jgi:hypothetical protein
MTIQENSEIRAALERLNQEFSHREAHDPAEGYRVQFLQNEGLLEGRLLPVGKRAGKGQFSTPYSNKCLFCDPPLRAVHKIFQDQNRVIVSLSHQLLIIPQKHYAHWFEAPIEDQIQLLKQAIEMRSENPSAVRFPIELHCGSAAGQTIFHLHVRTGVCMHKCT